MSRSLAVVKKYRPRLIGFQGYISHDVTAAILQFLRLLEHLLCVGR